MVKNAAHDRIKKKMASTADLRKSVQFQFISTLIQKIKVMPDLIQVPMACKTGSNVFPCNQY